jgi:hypothetical protein
MVERIEACPPVVLERARERLTGRGGSLVDLYLRLAVARATPSPVVARRTLLIVTEDLAAAGPFADDHAAACQVARVVEARVTVVALVPPGAASSVPKGVIGLEVEQGQSALEAGATLLLALYEAGVDLIGLLTIASTSPTPPHPEPRPDLRQEAAVVAASCGVTLAAAALRLPVVCEGAASHAAAGLATALAGPAAEVLLASALFPPPSTEAGVATLQALPVITAAANLALPRVYP